MNNSSLLQVAPKQRELFSYDVATSLNAFFAIISLAGALNDLIVILVLCKDRTLRIPYQIILLNLFIADLMFTVTIQPFIWIDLTKIDQKGMMAGLVCASTVGLVLPMVCMTANSFSLFAATVVRYLSIVRNYRGFLVTSKTFTKGFCVFSWITGIFVATPSAFSFRYNHEDFVCYREWPIGINGVLYSVITTGIFFICLLTVMVACYVLLTYHIWKQSLNSTLRDSAADRAKKSVSVLLGLLLLVVVVSWAPLLMVWFLGRTFNHFLDTTDGEFERQRWLRIAITFAMLSPVLDPLIYAYSSSEYRASLVKLFRSIRPNRIDVAGANTQ